jgi:CMP-N,N'-diacetyllegionaminic acid synthase
MRTIALIPARAGSKRLPGKNLRCVGGVSLLARAIDCALEAGIEAWVSTEDIEISRAAKQRQLGRLMNGEPVKTMGVIDRPEALAADDTQMVDVALHEPVVLCQPTSPFRTPETIRRALEAFDGNPVVSVSAVTLPEHAYAMRDGLLSEASVVTPNGCVYVVGVGFLRLYRSFTFMARGLLVEGDEALDIDTHADWMKARVVAGETTACTPYGEYIEGPVIPLPAPQRVAA